MALVSLCVKEKSTAVVTRVQIGETAAYIYIHSVYLSIM